MESDSADEKSCTTDNECLDDDESDDAGEELVELPGPDDKSLVEKEETNQLEENYLHHVPASQVCGTTETSDFKSPNHSDTVNCNKTDKLLQEKQTGDLIKWINEVNDTLLKSINYHNKMNMLPADGKFFVDADSLLVFALSNEEWGGRQYGQMLHVIYICERILGAFTRIGGICELVFLQSWLNVWADKFINLARTALMAHLKYNTNYAVHILPNAWDESFKSLLQSAKPNFWLQYLDFSVSNIVPNCCRKLAKILAQVNMNFIIASGVDCVDMFGFKLSIYNISAFVIKDQAIENKLMGDSANFLNEVMSENEDTIFEEIVIPVSLVDVRRDSFISAAAALLLHKNASQTLVRLFLLKCAFIEVLPLKLRACPKGEVSSGEVQEFVSLILHYMNVALNKIIKCNTEMTLVSKLCVRVADMWQENFFYKLLTTLRDFVLTGPSDLGNETAAAYLSLVQGVNNLCKANLDPFPINVSNLVHQSLTDTAERCENFYEAERQPTNNLSLIKYIPPTSQLVKEFCGESVLQNCWNTQEYAKVYHLICRNRDFKEIYNWNSKRISMDDTKRVTDSNLTNCELANKQRLQARQAHFMQIYSKNLEGNRIVSETIVRDLRKKQQPQNAHKKNKISQKTSKIIKEIEQKRKNEILKEESAKLKVLKSRQKGDVKQDIASKIVEVRRFLEKITSDEVKHEADMLMANLYFKLLKFKFKIEEQSQYDKVFIEFFLLLKELLCNCKKKIHIYLDKRVSDLNKPRINQSKKGTKQNPEIEVSKKEIKIFEDLNTICMYFNSLNFGEIAVKCKENIIRNCEPLTVEVLKIVEDRARLPNIFDTGYPWAQFQLKYLGPHLERASLGVFDEELGFAPDDWQTELVTAIKNRQSAIVVAPTSSGKTYASYYCMKSVLKESAKGVVVYVSPNKYLANQVSASIYARFKDTVMAEGMSLLGVFTRYSERNFENCQILVTNPECLEFLFLSPKHTRWVLKIRFIIFDEFQCLLATGSRISWESGLLLSKCPFLALSATIEKPQVLEQWLKGAAEYKKKRDILDGLYNKSNDRNYEVKLIIYTERHNELEKYNFANGELSHIHPYTFLTRKSILQHAGVPKALSLSPKETLQLYFAMKTVIEEEIAHLSPEIYFSTMSPDGFITKQHARSFELALNEEMYNLAQANPSRFQSVLTHLSDQSQIANQGTMSDDELFDLVENLNKNKMLPVIIFSYSRNTVEGMFAELTDYYTSKRVSSDDDDEVSQKKGMEPKRLRKGKEVVMVEKKKFSSLNLLSRKKSIQTVGVADSDDVKFIERELRREKFNSESPFVCGLRCGIGMHHGGMTTNMRAAVEILFRMKLLNVLISTGSLAHGIHMPCKTVVIAGETRFLNPISYQQMTGRAGRRGFDNEGHIVFWNIPHGKISNMLTSELPQIWGNVPMSVSVIVRLLMLVSKRYAGVDVAEEEIKCNISRALTFLNCNLVYQHFPDLKKHMKYFSVFSNQFLIVQQLVDDIGNPRALTNIVTNFPNHEPGNLVFVYLLRHGIFNKICKEEEGKISKQTELDLVLILSHLFTHIPLHKSSLRQKFKNSRVTLDKMPNFVIQEIEKYNEEVLVVFANYFKSVAKEYQDQIGECNSLPLSAVSFSPHSAYSSPLPSSFEEKLFGNVEERLICSSFAALSGHNDDCNETLFSTIRHEIFTDMKILPHYNMNQQLNGYTWDFYNHGLKKAIITDNNLQEGCDFALLQAFSHVLQSLYSSISEFGECDENKTVVEAFRVVSENYSSLLRRAFYTKR